MFSFQQLYTGKGFFLIFIVILCFDYLNKLKTLIGIMDFLIGLFLIIYGLILIIYGLSRNNKPPNVISPNEKPSPSINTQKL